MPANILSTSARELMNLAREMRGKFGKDAKIDINLMPSRIGETWEIKIRGLKYET